MKSLRILVLEDNPADVELALYELKRFGVPFEHAVARDRAEFVEALHAPFDVVLADFNLPQFDAFGALEEVRRSGADIPVVVVTGTLSDEDAVRCMQSGAADYLIKDRLARLGQAVIHAVEQREARAAERAARRGEEDYRARLEAIVRSTRDAILLADANGCLVEANPAAETLFGYSVAGWTDRPLWSSFAGMELREARGTWHSWIAAGEKEGELELLTPSGDLRLAEFHVTASVAPGVHLVVLRDVTQRRRAEEALINAQKLESLSVLAGGVAHDFNNFLVAVLGNADLALEDLPADSPVIDSLEQIKAAARRAADLARQMLALTGKGQFVVERVEVNGLVRELGQILRAATGRGITLNLPLAQRQLFVDGDSTQLRQIVLNLVVNASDAIGDDQGQIDVSTALERLDAAALRQLYFGTGLEPGDYVAITVCDDGPGMDPATQRRVFDPFFTTKFTGRGLGLAAVAGAVRGHAGAVGLHSRLGEGSTFTVYLPVSQAAPGAVLPPDEDDEMWRGEGSVLVVDDEEPVRAFASRALERMGFDVVTARNGREAVEWCEQGAEIALVLLDMTMPVLSGEAALRELKRLRPSLPVIMMSGYTEVDSGVAFDEPMAAFIQKPFEVATLRRLVRRVLA